MKTKDFFFNIPSELVAQNPPEIRGNSRLLIVDRTARTFKHSRFDAVPSLLSKGDVVVFNDTSVVKARVYGVLSYEGSSHEGRKGGKQIEVLLISRETPLEWKVLARGKRKALEGRRVLFPEGLTGTLRYAGDDFFLSTDKPVDDSYLERNGHVPLPPYIRRKATSLDQDRYETVYAETKGSIAAPTAGLHFTEPVLAALENNGVDCCFITLHVGLGTFMPIRSESIEEHVMHEEMYEISEDAANMINGAMRRGGNICAVGTTSVRTLESAWENGKIVPGKKLTNLYIRPGYAFKAVDKLITNFHTPESSLLVLVSAFAGLQLIKNAYEEAAKQRYRFFSYGDAMFIS